MTTTATQQVQKAVMDRLGPPGLTLLEEMIQERRTVDIVKGGTQIVLPEAMSKTQAVAELKRQMEQDEQVVSIHEVIDAYPLDGAHAMMLALRERFGWANLEPTTDFFGSRPPTMVGVEVGLGKIVQVPWGRMTIPGIDGYLATGVAPHNGRYVFALTGEVKRKNQDQVAAVAQLVRDFISKRSIYRGQAIRHKFENNFGLPPRFMDTSKVAPDELILSSNVMRQVRASIFTPIRRRSDIEQMGIRFGRRVTLAGPYGVGKTQTAYLTAGIAVEYGVTFIYLEDIYNLGNAIEFARQYAPALVFCEDIDRLTGRKKNDGPDDDAPAPISISDVSLMLDGITSKGEQVMVVLTTNHPEEIPPILLRCGRSDHLIMMGPPDGEAAERLVRLYAKQKLAPNIDLSEVREKLAGNNPATIREVVERSMLYAFDRGASPNSLALTASDLDDAYEGMQTHLQLLKGPSAPADNEVQILAKFTQKSGTNGAVHA